MHDIGKLVVNNDILEKPTALTENEKELMMYHVIETKNILSGINGIEDIVGWTSRHHERLDGSGYPKGLKEADLSFEDKLLSHIDIYQALREKRSYKEAYTHEEAIEEMKKMNGLDMHIIFDIDNCFKEND